MKLYTLTQADLLEVEHMRNVRNQCVFTIINRGRLWYDLLSAEQLEELDAWYKGWLDFTETGIVPQTPKWLENEVQYEVVL